MDINLLRICVTVASFIAFVGIMVWVWRHRDTQDFRDAANLPFQEEK